MTATITAAANVYNECNAIPGWLEMATAFFDDVLILHAGPGGKKSNDGTMEILAKWGVRVLFDEIDKGYGTIRTRLIRECKTEYVCILDADERLFRFIPRLQVSGQPTPDDVVEAILGKYAAVSQSYDTAEGREADKVPSNYENMKVLDQLGMDLRVTQTAIHDQGAMLRTILATRPDVVQCVRRHWHDFTWTRPTQDWFRKPDLQWRIIRCDPKIYFEPGRKMHEKLVGFDDNRVYRAHPSMGPFYDHYHLLFKRMEPEQRAEDVRTYNRIHSGAPPAVGGAQPHAMTFAEAVAPLTVGAEVVPLTVGGAQPQMTNFERQQWAKAIQGPIILLNIGAGGTLPGPPWINVDYPHRHDDMPNYVCHDAANGLPFPDDFADGLIACHFLEHFDCLKAVEILREFRRVLKPGGVCRIVVPDAAYFRKVFWEDLADPMGNAERLFGEPLAGRERAKLDGGGAVDDTFMSFALFWADHKQLFTDDSLWCELVQAGFDYVRTGHLPKHQQTSIGPCRSADIALELAKLDNREKFSLRMEAVK